MSRGLVDSGVEWIGKMPANWKLRRIGNLFEQRSEKVSDIEYEPLSVTKNGIVKQLATAAKSNDHTNRKKVCLNDFVINSRSDRKMSSGVSPLEGSVSLINIVLHSTDMDPSYVNYLLKNYGFAEEFYRWGTGIVEDLWSTNYSRMKKILIPIPSTEEQHKIANFLDRKVFQIDLIVKKTKQSIEELKKYKQSLITEIVTKGLNPNVEMVKSNSEWFNEFPIGWREQKLKYAVNLRSEKEIYSKGSNYIGLENIEGFSGKIISLNKDYEEVLTNVFHTGDVLFNKLRPYLTKGFIAKFNGYSSGELLIFKNFEGYNQFLLYYLLSNRFINVVNSSTYGTKMPRANWDFIKELPVFLPSLSEQKHIVNYLNERSENIDTLIINKEKLISEIESYKKSLIYEYVTGKKEVM
ncbi:restriction endonuclease subunit S [Virgibacillus dokdonensis]|uniref:restriction endonuclease subunit S n=1 Tax=Virgibacillus dokdonensis TaxID=302167 RepID=UPI00098B4BAE|nr:restriction endonuclease subunit S [Virgibacillus dokdonensis]